jgi:hypothetical protein
MREVVVVSGLPRSGTSMMMRMLAAGGIGILTDAERSADEDNPRGYFELEAVKRTDADASWLDDAEGKAVKVIARLLSTLPQGRRYKVLFMRRKLDEVLASQKRMLERRGEPQGADDEKMKELFAAHLAEVEELMRGRPGFDVLFLSYNRMVEDPRRGAERVNRFLGGLLDLDAMVAAIDPSLYRNRA